MEWRLLLVFLSLGMSVGRRRNMVLFTCDETRVEKRKNGNEQINMTRMTWLRNDFIIRHDTQIYYDNMWLFVVGAFPSPFLTHQTFKIILMKSLNQQKLNYLCSDCQNEFVVVKNTAISFQTLLMSEIWNANSRLASPGLSLKGKLRIMIIAFDKVLLQGG